MVYNNKKSYDIKFWVILAIYNPKLIRSRLFHIFFRYLINSQKVRFYVMKYCRTFIYITLTMNTFTSFYKISNLLLQTHMKMDRTFILKSSRLEFSNVFVLNWKKDNILDIHGVEY